MIAQAIGTSLAFICVYIALSATLGLVMAGFWAIYRRLSGAPAIRISEWIFFFMFWYAVFGAITILIALIGALSMPM